jgi:hypothetical protein
MHFKKLPNCKLQQKMQIVKYTPAGDLRNQKHNGELLCICFFLIVSHISKQLKM